MYFVSRGANGKGVTNPEVTMTVDVDPADAIESRRRIFDQVASDRLLVTGMHLHYPKIR